MAKKPTKKSKNERVSQGGLPPAPPPPPPPPKPKNPLDVPMSNHSSFFHLSTSMR